MFEDLRKHTDKRSRTSTLLIMISFVIALTICLAAFDAAVQWWWR